METNNSRGWLTLVSGVVAAVLLVIVMVPLHAQERRFDGVTLRVATYGGSSRDALHELIGKELERRGGKVEYVIGSPRDNLAKLIASRGRDVPFDVMDLDGIVKAEMLEANLLEQLDFSNIPNAQNLLDPTYKDRYTVVVGTSQDGIIFNTEKLRGLGLSNLELKDLFDPRLVGRLALPDISHVESTSLIAALARERGGDEGNIDPALSAIRQLNVAFFFRSSPELAAKVTSGDIWVSWLHAGWAVRLRRAGVPIGMSFPQIGKDHKGALFLGMYGVPKGGKARPAAEFWINQYLDTDVAAEIHRRLGIGPALGGELPKLAADPELKQVMLLSRTEIGKMYQIDFSKINMREWTEKWNRTIGR